MEFTPLLFVLVVAVIAALGFLMSKSNFVGDLLTNNYSSRGCVDQNRAKPQGKVPGSYFGLTEAEKKNLLRNFINNGN